MKLKIVGSGGMSPIPCPFCGCRICAEARVKRGRFERLGPSLYVEDIKLLIDTPEDILIACERQGVSEIKYLSVSHRDPDHVRGIRLVEPLGFNAITEKSTPVPFIALPEVIADINAWNGDTLGYYSDFLHCITVCPTDQIKIGGMSVRLVNNRTNGQNMTFYVLEQDGKKAVYACCDDKPFRDNALYEDADVLIIGIVSDDGVLKDGSRLEDAPFRDEVFTLGEIAELKNRYRIKRVVVTHIDEYWAKSYDEYRALEKKLDGIVFAYDGMTVEI